MRPKKAKELIPAVSMETGQPLGVVQDVVNFYWQEVRKNVSALSSPRIHLLNLGDFTFKYWKLEDKLRQLEQFEENNHAKGMQRITARFKTAEGIYELKLMREMLNQESQRKLFIQMHNKAFKAKSHGADQKNIPAALDQPGGDHGGDSQQCL